MKVELHPGSAIFAELLRSTVKPRERFELAKSQIIYGPAFADSNQAVGWAKDMPPIAVMQAVLRDGYDYLAAQQMFGMFSPARKIEASAWALEQLHATNTFAQIAEALVRAAEHVPAAWLPETTRVLLIPADPSNRNLMIRNSGLSMLGTGSLFALTVWPSAGNLQRVPAAAVRSWALGVIWQASGTNTPYTLASALASEGQALALMAQLFPNEAAPWLVPHAAPASWPTDLDHVALLYGVEGYNAVPANIYGGTDVHVEPPPVPRPMNAEEQSYAAEQIVAAHQATDPRTIAAYLYGDEIASAQGHPQAGLPPYAGFEVAFRHATQHISAES